LAWTLEFSKSALISLKKMNLTTSARIVEYLSERVAPLKNPRELGKAMVGKKYEDTWRYRIGDYRVLAEIREHKVTIVIVEAGHRREIYR
jgi:mRNA interferase RelE/StbE